MQTFPFIQTTFYAFLSQNIIETNLKQEL